MQRETTTYNGRKFHRYPDAKRESDRRYFKGWVKIDGKKTKITLHRYMWLVERGPIPEGYHVHHVDGDYSNNTIDNLALLLAHDHESLHNENVSEEIKEMRKQALRDNRDKAAEWHNSEEGRKWHSQNAKKQMAKREFKTYTCQCCGKEFRSRSIQGGKFCGNNCKSKWRRDQGLDNVERVCAKCGSKFVVNRYSKQKYCGMSCASKYRRSLRGL